MSVCYGSGRRRLSREAARRVREVELGGFGAAGGSRRVLDGEPGGGEPVRRTARHGLRRGRLRPGRPAAGRRPAAALRCPRAGGCHRRPALGRCLLAIPRATSRRNTGRSTLASRSALVSRPPSATGTHSAFSPNRSSNTSVCSCVLPRATAPDRVVRPCGLSGAEGSPRSTSSRAARRSAVGKAAGQAGEPAAPTAARSSVVAAATAMVTRISPFGLLRTRAPADILR